MKRFFLALLLASTVFAYTDTEIVATTLIAEAGGEKAPNAMEAVYEVICNRSVLREKSLSEVCLQRKQFSCWNNGDISTVIAEAKLHTKYDEAVSIVENAAVTNYTNGATHYHSIKVIPYWSKVFTKTAKIGNHIFYSDRK